jgi:predicted DNA-binding transcriptional regulator AlpA
VNEPKPVLQPDEAAALLGYSREVLLRECRRGQIPFRKLNARKFVFVTSELMRWIDRQPGRRLSEVLGR